MEWPILTKFGKVMRLGPPAAVHKILWLRQSKMAAAAILKNRKILISSQPIGWFWRALVCWCVSNLVSKFDELLSSNLGVYAVKTCHFCRHAPAIWRRSSFVTLAFRNRLENRNFDFSRVTGNDFCTPCRNLVRFGSVNPEFKTYEVVQSASKIFWGDFRKLSRGRGC